MNRLSLCLFLLACSGDKEGSGDDTPPEETASPTDDSGGADGTDTNPPEETGLPSGVTPFEVQISDGTRLTFDASTCQWPGGTTNFRQFWRVADGSHVYVLIIEILGGFAGAGTYTNDSSTARVRLQEEAGGSGGYYAADPAQGDTVSITIDSISDETWEAWGSATVSSLHSLEGAAVTLTPSTLPVWCPEISH